MVDLTKYAKQIIKDADPFDGMNADVWAAQVVSQAFNNRFDIQDLDNGGMDEGDYDRLVELVAELVLSWPAKYAVSAA